MARLCSRSKGPGLGCHRECSGGPVDSGVGGAVLGIESRRSGLDFLSERLCGADRREG